MLSYVGNINKKNQKSSREKREEQKGNLMLLQRKEFQLKNSKKQDSRLEGESLIVIMMYE
jgi:hypothetical protein